LFVVTLCIWQMAKTVKQHVALLRAHPRVMIIQVNLVKNLPDITKRVEVTAIAKATCQRLLAPIPEQRME